LLFVLVGSKLFIEDHSMMWKLSLRGRFLFSWISVLMAGMTLPGQSGAEKGSAAERLVALNRPLVIGHRGYSQMAPENTLPSFKLAKSAGADLVELDYHHTKDGVPVVIHDFDLDRTTDAVAKWGGKKIRVDSKTAAELRALDAGKWFAAQYAGTRLPSLSETLELIQDGGMTLIERKGGEAATLVKLLRERKLVNRLIVQSFDWTYLEDFHRLEPAQVLGALGPPSTRAGEKLSNAGKKLDAAWIADAAKAGAGVIVWSQDVTREAVALAHAQGVKVWIYTIDDPADANRLLDWGVDGIISNNPALIWKTLALRGLKPSLAP
jgi:glycerophosphoryl diester phosphodiesterase